MSNTELDEEQLIEIAKSNPSAFAIIYKKYVKNIYNYFYYRTFDINEAEDLTSQTFEKVLRNIKKYRTHSNFSAWLYRIAKNALIDYYRKQKVQIDLEKVNICFQQDYTGDFEKKERYQNVVAKIQTLSNLQKEVLNLKYQHSLTNIEIGKILGKSEGSVKQIAYRALNDLREKLKGK